VRRLRHLPQDQVHLPIPPPTSGSVVGSGAAASASAPLLVEADVEDSAPDGPLRTDAFAWRLMNRSALLLSRARPFVQRHRLVAVTREQHPHAEPRLQQPLQLARDGIVTSFSSVRSGPSARLVPRGPGR